MNASRRPLAVGAVVAAIGLTLGGISLASAADTPSTTLCATQEDALECVAGLKQYIEEHPDEPTPTATTATPTATATPSTSPTPTATATPTATPTTTPASNYASGLPWSSGVWSQHDAAQVTAFATMRGKPVDNIGLFPSRGSWSAMLNTWYLDTVPSGFTGDLAIAVPLWPENSSVTANATANWKTFATSVKAADPDAYIRLGWEMNIGQYWKVTAANRTNWITAFNNAVDAMHSVAPDLRIVWNPNWSADQTDTDSRGVFQQVKSKVDVYGIDIYDSYPPDNSDANAAARLNGSRGLKESAEYAATNGKKFALPEWGVACTTSGCQWQGNAGGDNPRYINDTLNFLESIKTQVAFESYFNDAASYLKSNLSPTTTNPQAAAAYRTKLAALGN